MEFGWSPADHEQAEDRIHRIGQEADAVFIYYLVAKNTIEEQIVDLIQSKGKVVSNILDGIEKEFFDSSILDELLKGKE